MGAKRPKSVKETMYIEIDKKYYEETGKLKAVGLEPISCPTIIENVPRGKFEIVYTAELFDVMRQMGNRKIEVLSYLLDEKDGNNTINASVSELSKKLNISRPTVSDTVNLLEAAGLLKRKGTVIMMSPNLMVKGNQIREAFLMKRYVEMDENNKPIIEAKLVEESQLVFDKDTGEPIQEGKAIPLQRF